MSGEQMPGWYFAHAEDDLNLRILRMFKGTFSLDTAQLVNNIKALLIQSLVYFWAIGKYLYTNKAL